MFKFPGRLAVPGMLLWLVVPWLILMPILLFSERLYQFFPPAVKAAMPQIRIASFFVLVVLAIVVIVGVLWMLFGGPESHPGDKTGF